MLLFSFWIQYIHSCEGSRISNASIVWCDGGRGSCQEATMIGISTIYVLGSGYRMTYNSNFISNGIGYMSVYLMAYNTGDELSIYCNISDKCLIYCGMFCCFALLCCF